MKFAIDRIEENIAICQNIETKEIIEIDVDKLPKEIKEGCVIYFDGKDYLLDEEEENKIRKRIEDKMNKLWE